MSNLCISARSTLLILNLFSNLFLGSLCRVALSPGNILYTLVNSFRYTIFEFTARVKNDTLSPYGAFLIIGFFLTSLTNGNKLLRSMTVAVFILQLVK